MAPQPHRIHIKPRTNQDEVVIQHADSSVSSGTLTREQHDGHTVNRIEIKNVRLGPEDPRAAHENRDLTLAEINEKGIEAQKQQTRRHPQPPQR